MELTALFADAWRRPQDHALRWKKQGGRVVGIFWDYVPEELLHAAGLLPYRILGSTENITEADRHMPTYVCSLMRSSLDQALKGEYSFMDGLIASPFWCEAMRPLWELWRAHAPSPWMESLDLPGITEPGGRAYFAAEITRLKSALEELVGREITAEDMAGSIRVYNEGRSLLKRLFLLRQRRLSRLSSVGWAQVVLSSMFMPREEHNRLLAELAEALEASPVDETDDLLRLHVTGTILIDMGFLQIIDEAGAAVTSDDLYTGARWYWDLVDEHGPPLESIIERYWTKLPCPARSMPRVRFNQILDFMKLGRSQGVVFLTERHCDPHIFEDPLLKTWLEKMGVPCLQLDTELALRAVGQIRTRVQTFAEMARKGQEA
ncbi:MAG: 2-hydroxyacyl-CoA dehydratase family protein [Dehalococcoidia bacterium]|nr:2-hydroxyacyl-CoA dehydratase family protein [Dehalococcoidia bacterium]